RPPAIERSGGVSVERSIYRSDCSARRLFGRAAGCSDAGNPGGYFRTRSRGRSTSMSVPSLSLKGLRWKPALLALTTLVLVLSLAQAGQAQALTITTNALPDAVRGSPYMFTVQ